MNLRNIFASKKVAPETEKKTKRRIKLRVALNLLGIVQSALVGAIAWGIMVQYGRLSIANMTKCNTITLDGINKKKCKRKQSHTG